MVTFRTGPRTEALVTNDVQGAVAGFGWLMALPQGLVVAGPGDPEALLRLDLWSSPLVSSPSCGDLAQAAPVGCGESLSLPPEIPIDHPIDATPGFAQGGWEIVVLDETLGEVTTWLEERAWVPPVGGTEEIARLASVAHVFVAAAWAGPPPADGSYLPPIALAWDEAVWEVPLRLSHFSSGEVHDTVLYTLTAQAEGIPNVPNYERTSIDADCMPDAASPDAWYDETLSRELPLANAYPGVLVEHAGGLGACEACAGTPPDAAALGWMGKSDPWVSRLRMRYTTTGLDQDPTLTTPGITDPVTHAYWTYAPDLEWAFPVCDEGYRDDPGSCEPIHLKTRSEAGCATTPTGGILLVGLAAVLIRRRRAVLLGLFAASAARAEDSRAPTTSASAELPVWSTPRLADSSTGERGAPSSLYPTLGAAGRVTAWRNETLALAVSGGLRGFAGRASSDPSEQYVLWTFIEPHVGGTLVVGHLREAYASPMAAVGAELALGVLDASVYRPQLSLGPLVHLRAGAWLGDAASSRTEIAVVVSAIPVPGAQIVQFRKETLLPGWRFNEGTVNVQLTVGGVWDRVRDP